MVQDHRGVPNVAEKCLRAQATAQGAVPPGTAGPRCPHRGGGVLRYRLQGASSQCSWYTTAAGAT